MQTPKKYLTAHSTCNRRAHIALASYPAVVNVFGNSKATRRTKPQLNRLGTNRCRCVRRSTTPLNWLNAAIFDFFPKRSCHCYESALGVRAFRSSRVHLNSITHRQKLWSIGHYSIWIGFLACLRTQITGRACCEVCNATENPITALTKGLTASAKQ